MNNLDTEMQNIMTNFLSEINNQSGTYGKAKMAVDAMAASIGVVSMFAEKARELLKNTDQGMSSEAIEMLAMVQKTKTMVNNVKTNISTLADKEKPEERSMDELLFHRTRGGSKKKRHTKRRKSTIKRTTKKMRKKRRTKRRR